MKKIDTEFDSILKVNYDLCKSTLNDFKELVKSWYDFDITKLDNRIDYRIDEKVLEVVDFRKMCWLSLDISI